MLVVLPIGLYVATLGALIAFVSTADPFFFRAALSASVGGVIAAVIAATFGTIDLFALPRGSAARATGIKHASVALLATGLFAVCAALLWRGWQGSASPDATVPLVLAIAGVLVLAVAGVLGWALVQTHHVGVRDLGGADVGGGGADRTFDVVRS